MIGKFVDEIRTEGTANVLQHMITVQSKLEFEIRPQKGTLLKRNKCNF